MEPFIIENGGNTCYIDSLLIALFYDIHFDTLLKKDLKNTIGLYLQEYIKNHFIDPVRDNKSIPADIVNMIRTLCCQLGWGEKNQTDFLNQQDVTEFYAFLMDIFENEQIEIKINSITENTEKILNSEKNTIPFIPLALPSDVSSISVKQMLYNWLYDNIANLKKNEHQIIQMLNTYEIVNTPKIIALSINRFNNVGIRINTDVIIQKKIVPSIKKQILGNNEWDFCAAICHKGDTNNAGHYYTLFTVGNKWYIFNDLTIPCMIEVSMADKNIIDMIKKECVFLIYKLF